MQVSSDLELGFFEALPGYQRPERITGRINLKMNFKELVDLSAPQKEMSRVTQGYKVN